MCMYRNKNACIWVYGFLKHNHLKRQTDLLAAAIQKVTVRFGEECFSINSSLITWDKTSVCKAICTIKSLKRDLDYALSFMKALKRASAKNTQEAQSRTANWWESEITSGNMRPYSFCLWTCCNIWSIVWRLHHVLTKCHTVENCRGCSHSCWEIKHLKAASVPDPKEGS